MRRGLESPIDQDQLIAETQARARELIGREGLDESAHASVWQRFTDAYFLRHTPEEIAWHTRMLAQRDGADSGSLVSVQQQSGRGGTGISTYTPHRQHSFARTTALLDQLGLTIVDARITPTADGSSLDVYHVLEDTGDEIGDPVRIRDIQQQLAHVLSQEDHTAVTVTRRAPRQVRMFSTPTQITFSEDPVNRRTIVELIAGDRPGLLSQIAQGLHGRARRHLQLEDHDGRRARRGRVLRRRRIRPAAQRRGAAAPGAAADRVARPPRMNPALAQLRPYPFERLRALLAGAQPPAGLPHISMSIGEPRHTPPHSCCDALTANLARIRQLSDDARCAAAAQPQRPHG